MNLSRTPSRLAGVSDVMLDLSNEDAVRNIEAFAAKIKSGDYGRLDEKDMEKKGFTLDGKVL